MGVDAHVPSGTGERFSLAIGDVLLGLGVAVLLGHAEIDNMDDIRGLGLGAADQEVIRFDITVNEVLLMDGLNPRQLHNMLVFQTLSQVEPDPLSVPCF